MDPTTIASVTVDPAAWADLWPAFDPLAESVAFVVGRRELDGSWHVEAFWPTPNAWQDRGGRGADQGYAIGKAAWQEARERAAAAGLEVLGHIHSHLSESIVPSFFDVRAVKSGDLGAVWHLGSGTVLWFTRGEGGKGAQILALDQATPGPVVRAWIRAGLLGELLTLPKAPLPKVRKAPPMGDPAPLITETRRILALQDDPARFRAAAAASGADADGLAPEVVAPLRAAMHRHKG